MDSILAFLCVRHVTMRDSSCAGCTGLSCRDWTVIVSVFILCLHSGSYMWLLRSVFGHF